MKKGPFPNGENLKWALEYRNRHGLSVVPIRAGDKVPLASWKDFQNRKAEEGEIREWFTRYPEANLGAITGAISDLAVIDIDSREGKKALDEILPDSFLSPTARTPRGGEHLFCLNCAGLRSDKAIPRGVDIRAEGGLIVLPPSIGKNGKPYAWVPGLSLADLSRPPFPPAYRDYILNNHLYKEGERKDPRKEGDPLEKMFRQGTRDNDLHRVASYIIRAGGSETEARQVIQILARNCNPPFPEKEIEAKIQSVLRYVERRERDLKRDFLEWVTLQEGYWNLTEARKTLQILTREEKGHLDVIVHRLKKEGIIEKYGNKAGEYRTVQGEAEEIDFLTADTTPLPLRWPFHIQNLVRILPKNIVIIAGAPNAGKTAFLLNFARMNQEAFRVHYFSSEMGAAEFKERLQNFDHPLNSWKMRAIERAGNFEDVIQPDDINIIDFLEIHTDFFKIGAEIKRVYDKLKGGIAVIAIQKNIGTPYGLGGFRGMEKARLYLSMEPGTLKIMKGKLWANHSKNPNGLSVDFKLAAGSRFVQQSDWKHGGHGEGGGGR